MTNTNSSPNTEAVPNKLTKADLDELREFARLAMNVVGAMGRYTRFDQTSSAVVICIYLGEADGNLFDSSSMAEYLGLPRPTIVRSIRKLEERGAITSEKRGRRVVYKLTFSPETAPNGNRVLREVRHAFYTTMRTLKKENLLDP